MENKEKKRTYKKKKKRGQAITWKDEGQDKKREDKTVQAETRVDMTRQESKGQDTTIHDKT